jgi:hypothetical protein
MVEARRYRRVLLSSGLNAREIGRLLNFPAYAVERLLAGKVRLLTETQADKIERRVSRRTRRWLRESRRYEGVTARSIPAELVVPIVEQALSENEQATVEVLVGLPMRTLFRITHDCSGVEFRTADRIVTALLGPEAWLQPPLRGWYWGHGDVLRRERY